jgi:hypothetical protein
MLPNERWTPGWPKWKKWWKKSGMCEREFLKARNLMEETGFRTRLVEEIS